MPTWVVDVAPVGVTGTSIKFVDERIVSGIAVWLARPSAGSDQCRLMDVCQRAARCCCCRLRQQRAHACLRALPLPSLSRLPLLPLRAAPATPLLRARAAPPPAPVDVIDKWLPVR